MAGSLTGLPAHCFGQVREELRTAELLLFVETSTLLLTPAGESSGPARYLKRTKTWRVSKITRDYCGAAIPGDLYASE